MDPDQKEEWIAADLAAEADGGKLERQPAAAGLQQMRDRIAHLENNLRQILARLEDSQDEELLDLLTIDARETRNLLKTARERLASYQMQQDGRN